MPYSMSCLGIFQTFFVRACATRAQRALRGGLGAGVMEVGRCGLLVDHLRRRGGHMGQTMRARRGREVFFVVVSARRGAVNRYCCAGRSCGPRARGRDPAHTVACVSARPGSARKHDHGWRRPRCVYPAVATDACQRCLMSWGANVCFPNIQIGSPESFPYGASMLSSGISSFQGE